MRTKVVLIGIVVSAPIVFASAQTVNAYPWVTPAARACILKYASSIQAGTIGRRDPVGAIQDAVQYCIETLY